jgi:hypothetical protein
MTNEAKPKVEMDETARFYVVFSELAKSEAEQPVSDVPSDEIEEIQRVMRMVVDVNDEPPRFVTST